jgi:hypothetical protein
MLPKVVCASEGAARNTALRAMLRIRTKGLTLTVDLLFTASSLFTAKYQNTRNPLPRVKLKPVYSTKTN